MANIRFSVICAVHSTQLFVLFIIVKLSNKHCEQSWTSQPLLYTSRYIYRVAKCYHLDGGRNQLSLTSDFNSVSSNGG